jgi:hypothetical protein
MADFRAIIAVSNAVLFLLKSDYTPDDFNSELEFKVYQPKDFAKPMTAGVSLFLYRIFPNGSHRTPSGRIGPDGRRQRTQLPLDLHFLLTAWGNHASLQQTIAGWMMRTLEDTPILPSALLNAAAADDVFHADEAVEINLTELRTEDMLRIWETLTDNAFHLSVPYVARNVRIESRHALAEGEPVQTRTFDYRVPSDGNGSGGQNRGGSG